MIDILWHCYLNNQVFALAIERTGFESAIDNWAQFSLDSDQNRTVL